MRTGLLLIVLVSGCTKAANEPPPVHAVDSGPQRLVSTCQTSSQSSPCISGVEGNVSISIIDDAASTAPVLIPTSKEQLLEMLREVPPGQLLLIGYAGADGDAHALSADDLTCVGNTHSTSEPTP